MDVRAACSGNSRVLSKTNQVLKFFDPPLSLTHLPVNHCFKNMAPVDWNALAPREASPAKTKEADLLARWKGVTERFAAEALCRPDDKESLQEDMKSWVRRWDEMTVSFADSCSRGTDFSRWR
jgi:hypothetical protein